MADSLTFALLAVRDGKKDLIKQFDRTEEDLKALQSVGQIIGEVLRQLDEERCTYTLTPFVCASCSHDPSHRKGI